MKALEVITNTTSADLLSNEVLAEIKNVPVDPNKKIDHVAFCFTRLEIAIKAQKALEQQANAKRKQLEAILEQAQVTIKEEMNQEGLCEITGDMIKFTVSRSNPKLVVEDENLIPAIFKREVITLEIDKEEIKAQLKNKYDIPGTRLEYGSTLKVGMNKGA